VTGIQEPTSNSIQACGPSAVNVWTFSKLLVSSSNSSECIAAGGNKFPTKRLCTAAKAAEYKQLTTKSRAVSILEASMAVHRWGEGVCSLFVWS
jgi:hypothetical protein